MLTYITRPLLAMREAYAGGRSGDFAAQSRRHAGFFHYARYYFDGNTALSRAYDDAIHLRAAMHVNTRAFALPCHLKRVTPSILI